MGTKPAVRILLICCVVTCPGPRAWALVTAPTWEPREMVASQIGNYTAHYGADRAMAYDHHGNPGIAFYDGDVSSGDLRYARRVPGVGWTHQVVDSGATAGYYPSLAFDRYERPAISYQANFNDLKYAAFDGSAWQLQTVDIASGAYYTSLAFDLLGRPAIAYRETANRSLKFVRDTDGDLRLDDETPVVVFDPAAEVGRHASLVFDGLNRPMIAHADATNHDLLFSVEEPGIGWVTTIVDGDSIVGDYPSIAIDPDTGQPAIGYYKATGTELRFAEWNGLSWDIETVDSFGAVGTEPSLAFDPADGNPAIAYHVSTGSGLKFAWHDGAQWNTQSVDLLNEVGMVPSLAFNEYGTGWPAIMYFQNNTFPVEDTIYFIEDPPESVPEPASAVLLLIGGALVALFGRRRARIR